MQALILAAGRGSRLREGIPKCLIRIGDCTLLDHQIHALRSLGIADICVVIGYEADRVRKMIGDQCRYVHNPRALETNSLYSLWLAREAISGPFLQLNGDVIADPRIYRRVLGASGCALAYDSTSGQGAEHMKVSILGGRLCEISKSIEASRSHGENLGILKYDRDGARMLFDAAGRLMAAGGEELWAPAAVASIAEQVPVRCVDVAGLPWTEIDYVEDALFAKYEIWPAVRDTHRASGMTGQARRAASVAGQVMTSLGNFGGLFEDIF